MIPGLHPFNAQLFFQWFGGALTFNTWSWWAAGLGIGLTALGLAWFKGRRLGVTGGFEDACSLLPGKSSSFKPSPSRWKLWFILGLPLGGFLANSNPSWSWIDGHLKSIAFGPGWSWLYGRLDGIVFGSFILKALWLLVGGFLIGFGARWAGGCTSGNSIMGISLGSKMSILATLAFLAAGILVTNILFKVF